MPSGLQGFPGDVNIQGNLFVQGTISTGGGGSGAGFPLFAPNGTVGAPSYAFANSLNTGWYAGANNETWLAINGVASVRFLGGNVVFPATFALNWSASAAIGSAAELGIGRDAANILGIKNGVNAMGARIYGTFTDVNNYERLAFNTVIGASVEVAAESAGTGSANLDLLLTPKGTGRLRAATVANGAVATALTAVGPAGAATTVQEWLSVKNAAGTVRFIPMF